MSAQAGIGSCPDQGIDSSQQVWLQYSCGCLGYKQISSLRRRPETALQCPEHGAGKRRPSQLALNVRAACQAAAPWAGAVALEACLLPGSQHRFDLFWVKYGIAAEVDGVQHFKSKMHSTSGTGH